MGIRAAASFRCRRLYVSAEVHEDLVKVSNVHVAMRTFKIDRREYI